MYELNYVRRRKARKIGAIVLGVSAAVVTSLSIVAFLGRFVGTFTVSLDASNVEVTLCENSTFESPTSYLRVANLPDYGEFTYTNIDDVEVVDNENSSYLIGATYLQDGATIDRFNYFKYTFFIANTGTDDCQFDFRINITDNSPSTDGRYLDETIRVMVYETDVETGKRDRHVYAKKGRIAHLDENGEKDYSEAISIREEDASEKEPFIGYATNFESSDRIGTINVPQFKSQEVRRYTLVMWLEGYDPESLNVAPPKGASLKIGVDINAYEI